MTTISDKTKVHLFAVIGVSAVLIPAIISMTMWFANLRYDTNQTSNKNTEQDQIIKEINEKLSVVYGFDSRLKSIESILKIKQEASLDKTKENLKL